PALTFNEGRPTWRRAVWTNSVEVPRDRRYFFIAATVGVAAAALLDVRASRQAQDRPLSADRRVEAILTTSARGEDLEQHRTIEVGDATLECTLRGSGAPIVLLANAGCSVGYFDHLARALATAGFQTISINMRGVGGSLGSLDGTTLHDLAGDVAGVIEAIGCGPAHLVGHAFGNRIARCLAVDRPSVVR